MFEAFPDISLPTFLLEGSRKSTLSLCPAVYVKRMWSEGVGNIISSLLAGPAERRQKIKPGLGGAGRGDTDPHRRHPAPPLALLTFENASWGDLAWG